MPKRLLDDGSSTHKVKKIKISDEDKGNKANDQPFVPRSNLTSDEVDFPRGGGTSFTPIEVKAIHAEALQEANGELFEVCPCIYILWYLVFIYILLGYQTFQTEKAEVRCEEQAFNYFTG